MTTEIDRLMALPQVKAIVEHHIEVFGDVAVHPPDDSQFSILIGARKIGSLKGAGEERHLKALSLALNGILAQLEVTRSTKIELSKRMMLLVERLQRAEEKLAGPMRRRSDDIERRSDQLAEAATTDPLTSVLNRRGLEIRLNKAVQEALLDSNPLTVMMIDVDHFKAVNDDYGHLVGDQVLALLGQTLKADRRSDDLIGRWGGEEFLIVLPDCDESDGLDIGESIRRAIEALSIPTDKGELKITASIGVSTARLCSEGSASVESDVLEIVSKADELLYIAKESGRNRVVSKK
jgi:diguanylate cyclase (GGDEF)-like protein